MIENFSRSIAKTKSDLKQAFEESTRIDLVISKNNKPSEPKHTINRLTLIYYSKAGQVVIQTNGKNRKIQSFGRQ